MAPPRTRVGMIWAQSPDGVIGVDGAMPWHVPEDLGHFRDLTQGHPVIMGRRTWGSFPERFRPLPGRTNIVVSRSLQPETADGAVVVGDFQTGLAAALEAEGLDLIWVIGGESLYEQALDVATLVERTIIDTTVEGDTFAPALDEQWRCTAADPAEAGGEPEGWHESRQGLRYRYERWERA